MLTRIVLSIDLELFSDTFAFQKLNTVWASGENGETGVIKLLELFRQHNITTTFFVVARHAKSHKHLLQQVKENGHEIASHTLTHRSLLSLTNTEIRSEVQDSKKILEDTIGCEVQGFRAPAFAINEYIVDTIIKGGYRYDSSVAPCIHIPGWYGFPNAPRFKFNIREIYPAISTDFTEFPVAVNPIMHIPVSGMWMRMLGKNYVIWSIQSLMKVDAIPVICVHPWELVELPRLNGIPWRVYHQTGRRTLKIIDHILKDINAHFVPIRDLL